MKIVLLLFVNVLITLPACALGFFPQSEIISSHVAVSQTGRFSVSYDSPLIIDKEGSVNLGNFIAYQAIATKNQIMIGAIPGDDELNYACKHPAFLQHEKIADVATIDNGSIHYFNTNQYNGCLINFNKNQSAIIVAVPKPFISQGGENVKLIGIVGNIADLNKLKINISFYISAKDFFINLLQLSQAFSPFNKEINWDSIKNQGLEFIGSETKTCRGLSAAAKFLIPALNKLDLHSFISLNGLGTASCPTAPLPENDSMKKWLAVPEATRKTIINYSSDFHGYELNQHIAYLYMPALDILDQESINKKIKNGREALIQANMDKACGVIVDLRFNYGGNLVPMLLTLGGILPSGKLFNIGENTAVYLSEDGNKLLVNTLDDIYGQYDGIIPNINRSKPVAILTNWITASSGNVTGLALRDNVAQARVFGTKTSPTASVNATFYLIDGNTLNLMIDRLYNKNGNVVPLALSVDEETGEDNLETIFNPDSDVTLNVARKWLETLPTCRNLSS